MTNLIKLGREFLLYYKYMFLFKTLLINNVSRSYLVGGNLLTL